MQETADAEIDGSPKTLVAPTKADRDQTATNSSLSDDIIARTVAHQPPNERMLRGIPDDAVIPPRQTPAVPHNRGGLKREKVKVKVSIRFNSETGVWTVKAPEITHPAPFGRGVLQVQRRLLPTALIIFRAELEMHYASLAQHGMLGGVED